MQPTNMNPQQDLQLQMFRKFLTDASMMLGNNPTPLALAVRIKIEEASHLGGLAIAAFQPAAPAEAQAPVPAPTEAVAQEQQAAQQGVAEKACQADAA